MADFAVWAPQRDRVRVQVDGVTHADDPRRGGLVARRRRTRRRRRRATPSCSTTTRPRCPTPARAASPTACTAPSQLYDHDAFFWTDRVWTGRQLPGSVLYELHIGTFTEAGTFDSAIERLDHLAELGVDLVEVLPVNAVDGPRNWGYDGVGWYAVTENYGGPDAFKRFVDACHAARDRRGAGRRLQPPRPVGRLPRPVRPLLRGQQHLGPHASTSTAPHSEQVRRYVIDNALMWLRDFHVDGLRLDAVHALHDRRAAHLLEQMTIEVEALSTHLGRPLSLIAESDLNDAAAGHRPRRRRLRAARAVVPTTSTTACTPRSPARTQGYYADFATAGLTGLAHVLTRAFLHEGTWSSFRQRNHGAPVDTRRIPGHRFVIYLQNHDQIGNRARGRPAHATTLTPGLARLRGGAAVLLAVHPDAVHGRGVGRAHPLAVLLPLPRRQACNDAVREGRRAEFAAHGWGDAEDVPDPNAESTFLDSKLDWTERDAGAARHGAAPAPGADRAAQGPAGAVGPVAGRGRGRRRRGGAHDRAAPRPAAAGVQPRATTRVAPGRPDRAHPAGVGASRRARGGELGAGRRSPSRSCSASCPVRGGRAPARRRAPRRARRRRRRCGRGRTRRSPGPGRSPSSPFSDARGSEEIMPSGTP